MLWAVSPARTLQDALAAELLQGHLAGGYQLRNPPLYEWLLWSVQQIAGPGPLSYLVLRYALIAATGLLFYVALPPHGREPTPRRRLLAVARAVLLVRLGDPSQRLSFACAARRFARAVHRRARLCRTADGHARISSRTDHRPWAHGQMELPARGAEPWGGARDHARDAAHLSRSAHAARARREQRCRSFPSLLWLASIDPDLISRRAVPPGSGLSAARSLQGALVFITGIPLVFLPWIAFVLFFAWRFPKTPPSPPALPQGSGDQTRRPHGDNDARGDGRAAPGRDGDGQRAVRHHPLRHPLSLPVLACSRRWRSQASRRSA